MNDSPLESHDYDASEFADSYQSLSVLAVLALLFGLLSPAVMFGTLAALLPCGAIFLAIVALGQIARSDGAVVGRGLATWGLALGVASLSAWVAYGQAHRHLVHQAAATVAQEWLDSIQQRRVEDAFLLTLPSDQRAAVAAFFDSPESQAGEASQEDGASGESHGGSPSPPEPETPAQRLEEYRNSPDVAHLLGEQGLTGYRLLSRGAIASSARRAQVEQTYEITLGDQTPATCTVILDKFSLKNGQPFWRVNHVKLGRSDG